MEEIAKWKRKIDVPVLACDCVQGFGRFLFSLNWIKADMVTMSSIRFMGQRKRAIYAEGA